jgi:hypothetical protein
MCRRSLVPVTIMTVVAGLLWLLAVPVAGQRAPLPRTAWGDPDLQGTWTNKTITPFERPTALADKEFLTEAEAAALEAANEADVAARDEEVPDDIVGNYNQHWFDRGTTVVGTRRTSIVVDPRDGKLPAFTAEAQRRLPSPAEARRLEDARRGRAPVATWEDLDHSDRCILWPTAGPPMLSSAYNNNYQIFQAPGYVAILIEMIHDFRIIPLDGRSHAPAGVRHWLGDSRGHWEGDTLVVETTNFSDKVVIRAAANAQTTEAMRIVERFRRVDDGTLEYRFTIDDPNTWTQPWTGELPMTRISERLYEYACHEGNQSLVNMLAGSRALEAAGAVTKTSTK